MYATILILGIGIVLIFRILSFLNRNIPLSKEFKHYTGYLLPVIELAVWLGFIIWGMRALYETKSYSTLIIFGTAILLLLVPSWNLIRDFIYGMLLKIQRKIELDSKIEIGNMKGTVVKIDHFTFDLKSKNGNIDTVPYNKIRLDIISKNGENINLEKQLIRFRIPSKLTLSKLIPQLKFTLINSPWVVSSQEPIVDTVNQGNDTFLIDVFVYLIDKEHAERIKEYVLKNFTQSD